MLHQKSRFFQDVSENFNRLKDAIEKMQKYSEINNADEITKDRITEAFRTTEMYYYTVMTTHTRLKYIFQACKTHFLPSTIIKKEKLIENLQKIQRISRLSNLDLALDTRADLQFCHHSKLINCFKSDNMTKIEIKVPLKKEHLIPTH